LKNEEDSQVSVLFNEEPGATQSQKFYDGAEDSLQKEKSEDARKIENSSFYEILLLQMFLLQNSRRRLTVLLQPA